MRRGGRSSPSGAKLLGGEARRLRCTAGVSSAGRGAWLHCGGMAEHSQRLSVAQRRKRVVAALTDVGLLKADADRMLAQVVAGRWLTAKAVVGFWPAAQVELLFNAVALAVLAAILTVGGIAMYEAALALLFLIPGYFFVQLGAGGVLTIARRKFWVWLIFAIGIGLYGVYLVSVSSGSSYQGNLVGGGSVLGLLAVTWPKLFTVGALHAVWG